MSTWVLWFIFSFTLDALITGNVPRTPTATPSPLFTPASISTVESIPVVSATSISTSTPFAPLSPTSTPTRDDLLLHLDSTWNSDWPTTLVIVITLRERFSHDDLVQEKFLAAHIKAGDHAVTQGRINDAIRLYQVAIPHILAVSRLADLTVTPTPIPSTRVLASPTSTSVLVLDSSVIGGLRSAWTRRLGAHRRGTVGDLFPMAVANLRSTVVAAINAKRMRRGGREEIVAIPEMDGSTSVRRSVFSPPTSGARALAMEDDNSGVEVVFRAECRTGDRAVYFEILISGGQTPSSMARDLAANFYPADTKRVRSYLTVYGQHGDVFHSAGVASVLSEKPNCSYKE